MRYSFPGGPRLFQEKKHNLLAIPVLRRYIIIRAVLLIAAGVVVEHDEGEQFVAATSVQRDYVDDSLRLLKQRESAFVLLLCNVIKRAVAELGEHEGYLLCARLVRETYLG